MADGDPSASQTVLKPVVKLNAKGRPPGAKNKRKNFTQWDLSAYEHEIAKSVSSKCSNCNQRGHAPDECNEVGDFTVEMSRGWRWVGVAFNAPDECKRSRGFYCRCFALCQCVCVSILS